MQKYSPQFWAAIRTDYCNGARTVAEICAYYGVSPSGLAGRKKREGWAKTVSALPPLALTVPEFEPAARDGTADLMSRALLAPRLKKLLARTVAEIELAACARTEISDTMDRARDVRTLTTVMRLIEQLDGGLAQTDPADAILETEENEYLLRQEIAERLGRLRDAGRPA